MKTTRSDRRRRFGHLRALLDAYVWRSYVWDRLRLETIKGMSDNEVLAAARAEADEASARNRELNAERLVFKARYEEMIEKVEAWEPPTSDHVNFKEFMLKQLRDSIDFDCREWDDRPELVSLDWRDRKIKRLERGITMAREEIVKQQERNAGRKHWVEALVESLEEPAVVS
jgi:hypothetical protein